ncbi:hypothetical protein ECZU29_18470 [Escherichia coli]|nr:hypothetical protein ECZU29_18470 [Escherichia coli]
MPREARDTMSLRSEFVLPAFSTVHNLMARGLLPGLVAAAPATGRFEHAEPALADGF